MRRLLFIAGLLAMLALGAIGTIVVQGHTGEATEVRINAQRLEDGRTEFALQQRTGDTWSDRILPSSRYFPADAEAGRWLNSTPIEVRSAEFQPIVISATAYPGSTGTGVLRFESWRWDDNMYTAVGIEVSPTDTELQVVCLNGEQFIALIWRGSFDDREHFSDAEGITVDVRYRFSGPYDEVTEAWGVAVQSNLLVVYVPPNQFATFMSRIRENRTLAVNFETFVGYRTILGGGTFSELARLLTTYVQPNIDRCGEY